MEALGVFFAICLVAVALWFAYTRFFGPVRQEERWLARRRLEEERARRWRERRCIKQFE